MVLIGLFVIFSYGMGNVSAASTSSGNTIYVNGSGGNDSNDGSSWLSAKQSINNATGTINVNGTINIANGNYSGVNNTRITIDKNMTIIGENQTGTIIDGTGTNWIFFIQGGLTTVTMENLTLANGNNAGGSSSAIANQGTLGIINITFNNNTAYDNGAIYNIGSLTVTNDTFNNNTALYEGGAIYNDGTLTDTNDTFNNNTAPDGGAIFNGVGSVTETNDTFTGNTASGDGGAICNGGTLTDTNSTFNNNTASGDGGAILNIIGSLTVTNSTFNNNTASGDGGAILNIIGSLTVTNDKFNNNTALYEGGAIYNEGTLTDTNDTFNNNTVTNYFGGAICNYGTLTDTNDTFNNNTAPDGGAIFNEGTATVNFNRIIGNSATDIYSIVTMNANDNWWGTNFVGNDPLDAARTNFKVDNWIILTVTANPKTINKGDNSTVTADLLHDNLGNLVNGYIPEGIPVAFNLIGSGDINPLNSTTTNETATTTFTGTSIGVSNVLTTVDEQTITTPITINTIPTNITVKPVTCKDNQTVTLNATLTDTYGNLLAGQTVIFSVNGHNYSAVIGNNGIATINYIPYGAGNYDFTVNYLGNDNYTASEGTGLLTVNPSAYLYLQITASNKNPKIGETLTLIYKLGNNGPDNATNITITIPLPSGFIISTINGDGNWTYNPTTKTITWTLSNLPVGDPYLYITGKTINSGVYVFGSSISSETYNLNTEGITPIIINTTKNSTNPVTPKNSTTILNTDTNTIPMQHTGIPIVGLIFGILSVISGSVMSRKK